MVILGIETSCDETAAAVIEIDRGHVAVRSHIIASQALKHAKYGGVVPEVAAREHVLAIIPTIDRALKMAGVQPLDGVGPRTLDRIAVTSGPGLLTALLVGVETAKALAVGWDKPLAAINHIEAHIASTLLPRGSNSARFPQIKFPALALVVSGGHSELILVKKMGAYKLIGKTRDDAAGEAFDKVAKILKLGYPGGPAIARAAKLGNPKAIAFPRPMISAKNFDFSFAGLKTSVLYYVKKQKPGRREIRDIAASFQQAVIDVLVVKTIRAARQLKVRSLLIGGGVTANALLRQTMGQEAARVTGLKYYQPNLDFATDNAAMIALAGYFHQRTDSTLKIKADSGWELV